MHIALYYTDGGGSQTLAHDLNFQSGDRYEKPQVLTFRNPKPSLLRALQGGASASSLKSDYENGTPKNKRAHDGTEKKAKKKRVVCCPLCDTDTKISED